MSENSWPVFTREMRDTHTILIPNMLPYHFRMMARLMGRWGYRVELLENSGRSVITEGLRYVHNDACYPAQLVIGQFIDALKSGKYDVDSVALLYAQTGGGCRASNYISLLRKALLRAGLGQIPVLSLNFSGLEANPGFRMYPEMLLRMLYACLYGDALMSLVNQCRPYEQNSGETVALADKWTARLAGELRDMAVVTYGHVKRRLDDLSAAFAALARDTAPRRRVGIVGEIFVKFSPLGNNNLEELLIGEGCEPVVPGFLDFALYCVYNSIADNVLYRRSPAAQPAVRAAYKILLKKQDDVNSALARHGFRAPQGFEATRAGIEGYVSVGVKMGEGWLLPAEMLELLADGVSSIVCVQPFGCLPNHIAGRGVARAIHDAHPEANICALDYESGTSPVNQHNRIKLMLSSNPAGV